MKDIGLLGFYANLFKVEKWITFFKVTSSVCIFSRDEYLDAITKNN